MALKGFYIEDDLSNITSYGQFFEEADIEILHEGKLLESPDDYYDLICKYDVDFVIIDNHLEKQGVSYDGFDVLKSIRKHDSSIYILLLTNFSYDDKSIQELGEFDQTIKKDDFVKQFDGIINRIRRATYRKEVDEFQAEVQRGLDKKQEIVDAQLQELKKISNSLNKLVKKD